MTKATTTALVLANLLVGHAAVADTLSSDEQIAIDAEISDSAQDGASRFNTNITANPLFLFFSGISATASFRLDKTLAVGPLVSTFSIFGARTTSIGVQGQYSLQNKDVMEDGWILDSSLELMSITIEDFDEFSDRAVLATTSGNKQWVYDNGFNVRVGVGLAAQLGLDGGVDYGNVSGSGAVSFGDNVAVHAFLDAEVAWAF